MKIAIFTDLYLELAGGIPSSVRAQKIGLEAAGHEVMVFCPGWSRSVSKLPKNERHNVVVVPTCKIVSPGGAPLARNPIIVSQWVMKRYPELAKFDLVHVHYEAGASIAGVLIAQRFNLPLVQTMHGREDSAVANNIPHPFKTFVAWNLDWFHSWYLKHEIYVLRDDYLATTVARAKMWTMMVNHANCADLVLTPSHHLGKKLKHYGVTRPMKVLSNGIADELMVDKVPVRKLRSGEPLEMLWNSRVSHEKRFLEFLKVLEGLAVPYKLHVYGDGNELDKGKKIVREQGLKVKFYGVQPRDKILARMQECHLSVLNSYDFDNQPMTLLEAELMGLPVLICDPDMSEVVTAGGRVLAKSPDVNDVRATIEDLYANPEKITQMSQEMIKHRREVLQSEKLKKLMAIYKNLKV